MNLPVLSSLQAPGPPQLLPCLCSSCSQCPSPTLLQGEPTWDSAAKKTDTIHCPPGDSLRMSLPPIILPRGSRVSLWPFSWLRAPRAGLEGRQFQATHCSFMFTIHPSSYLTFSPDTCCLPSTPIAATLLKGSALPRRLSDLASQQERGGRVPRTLGPCYQPHTPPGHREVPQRDAGFSSPSHEPLSLTQGLAIAL